jgi:5'-methylthioadenosine phosphorylase
MSEATVGVFGGSGFYSFLEDVREVAVDTPYGPTSDRLLVGEIGGTRVAFLPRHGRHHHLPPHRIPYRANIWAMREIGVRRIIGPCAAGSLSREVPPGAFVVCDQFVDRTNGRADTFFDGPVTTHVSAADPYCPSLRQLLVATGRGQGVDVRDGGTMVVIQGPRFSTRAESAWFAQMGWQVINMTGYPEAWLAREAGLCYANISLITDYDVGVEGDGGGPVSHEAVLEVFDRNNARLRELLFAAIPQVGGQPDGDPCRDALVGARL